MENFPRPTEEQPTPTTNNIEQPTPEVAPAAAPAPEISPATAAEQNPTPPAEAIADTAEISEAEVRQALADIEKATATVRQYFIGKDQSVHSSPEEALQSFAR